MTIVNEDAAAFVFPSGIDGALSTFALTLVPESEYDTVIRSASAALNTNSRVVVLDFKRPDAWPAWLLRLFVRLLKPFAVTLDLADRRPWQSMQQYMDVVRFEEFYFGGIYLCAAASRR